MKTFRLLLTLIAIAIIAVSCNQTEKQDKEAKHPEKYKMTTDIPASITTPDSVQTSLGMLRFFDGFPDGSTVQRAYDNLDFQRGVQSFLESLPAASMYATRQGYRTFGPDNQTILIAETFLDSRTL